MINQFLLALQFITRIPVTINLNFEPKQIAASMSYYPLIGTLLGAILALVNYCGEIYLPRLVNASVLVSLLIVLTGGLHLDGLMDTCDGIFSGREKDKILIIMRDSRVGSFGVVALVVMILLKFSLVVETPNANKELILIYTLTLSRWAMVFAAYYYNYARDEGLGSVYQNHLQWYHLLVATIWTCSLGIILFGSIAIGILLIIFLVTIAIAKVITTKIDGLTGDSYGAINEFIEVIALLLLVILI